jgi:Flp pilus assembly protein TadD
METGDYNDALVAYTYNPYNIQTLNVMGASHESVGRIDRAEWCYREALDIAPDYKDARTNLERLK